MRCRVGDLAVMVGCYFHENDGRLVTVVSRGVVRDWLIRSIGTGVISIPLGGGRCGLSMEAEAPDSILRPIRGEPETTQDEKDRAIQDSETV